MHGTPSRIADFWDEFVDDWLRGADPATGPLSEWFAACPDSGLVSREGLPELFGGDLRRTSGRSPVVVLAQHAGEYVPQFQSREGVFAQEIRACGSYSSWAATGPYLRDTWTTAVKPNVFYRDHLTFARRWLGDPALTHRDLVVFDAYPWHVAVAKQLIVPPARFVDKCIWQPVCELPGSDVFAFGAAWNTLAGVLNLRCVDALGKGGRPYGSNTPDRAVRIYEVRDGKRLIVEWHKGGSGPPSEPETRILKEALT